MAIIPIIMCGGAGSRLWPASRPSRPKQFIPLVGDRSTFQDTVIRVAGISGAVTPLVVAGTRHEVLLRRELSAIGADARLLLEPEPRDSAPAMAAAAAWALRADPDAVLVVVASDHFIPDDNAFRQACLVAAQAAQDGKIVTLGVRPAAPSTAYGYIKPGAGEGAVKSVAAFVEKPSKDVATQYLAEGYLWNSGNFIVRADRLLAELDAFAPEIRAAVDAAIDEAGQGAHLGPSFAKAPKISIDYAVMEKTLQAAVLPVDFHWSDLGAWDAIWEASPKDGQGNVTTGEVYLAGTTDSLVRGQGVTVAAVGVQRLAILAEKDAVLVCALDSAQRVKTVFDALKAAGSATADLAPEETLPQIAARLQLWLKAQALPLWHSLGFDQQDGFAEALDDTAQRVIAPRRARVQARQAYVFARAQALGWGGQGLATAKAGMASFEARHRRADGLFRTLCDPSGQPMDDTAMLYDHAFVLLAWSALGREADALALLDRIEAWRGPAGGFLEQAGPTFASNPHMHFFEAALAWIEAGRSSRWHALATELAELALTRFIDAEGGFVREFFDEAWGPAAGEAGRIVEPGHQFEWAWLMDRWARLSGQAAPAAAARRFYEAGLRGVDPIRGVAQNALLDDFTVHDAGARLWPQTEWLKAAMVLDPEGALPAARALDAYLRTQVVGLWRDKMTDDGRFIDEPAPASSLYHIAVAIGELTNL